MRKNLPLVLALALGGAGFALRKWQLAAGFEADTRLPIPGSAPSMLLVLLTVLAAAGLLVLVRTRRDSPEADSAFAAARDNTLFLTAGALSGFLLLLSAGLEIFSFAAVSAPPYVTGAKTVKIASMALPPLRVFLCAMGLPSAILWCRRLYRGEETREQMSLLFLCVLFCLWMVSAYQVRASDPVVMDYVYEVLAIVCSLLGLYYIAGYSFQTGKPRRTLFFCLAGVYFSLVTLADGHCLAETARYGFAVLFLAAHAALILNQPPAPQADGETEI